MLSVRGSRSWSRGLDSEPDEEHNDVDDSKQKKNSREVTLVVPSMDDYIGQEEALASEMRGETEEDEAKEGYPVVSRDIGHGEQIFGAAQCCDVLLRAAIENYTKDGNSKQTLEEIQERFLDWSSYLGVFAPRAASLDQRLRHHKGFRDLVLLSLEMLEANIKYLLPPERFGVQTTGSSYADSSDDRKVALEGIGDAIKQLNRLAVSIRQSSTPTTAARIMAFREKARHTDDFRRVDQLSLLIVDNLYPKAADSLRRQLSASLVDRYAKLRYWRSHETKLRIDRRAEPQTKGKAPEKAPEKAPSEPKLIGLAPPVSLDDNQRPANEEISTTDPSTFTSTPAEDSNKTYSAPQNSDGSSALLLMAKYPSPPKLADVEENAPCPFCRKIHRRDQYENKGWWKRHVDHDLNPYPCISEDCQDFPAFSKEKTWAKHMSEHGEEWPWHIHPTLSWRCDRPGHKDNTALLFDDQDDLEQHLRVFHDVQRISPIQKPKSTFLTPEAVPRRKGPMTETSFKLEKMVYTDNAPEKSVTLIQQSRAVNICPLCCLAVEEKKGNLEGNTERVIDGPNIATLDSEPVLSTNRISPIKNPKHVTFDPNLGSEEREDMSSANSRDIEEQQLGRVMVQKMAKHVASHLRSLAFLMLRLMPEIEDLGDEQDTDSAASNSARAPLSLRSDPRENTPAQESVELSDRPFLGQDLDLQSLRGNGNEADGDDASTYVDWGDLGVDYTLPQISENKTDLRQLLIDHQNTSLNGTPFWPIALTECILSRGRVISELSKYFPPDAIISLADRIALRSGHERYTRVFAMLVYLERTADIGYFIEHGLSDREFTKSNLTEKVYALVNSSTTKPAMLQDLQHSFADCMSNQDSKSDSTSSYVSPFAPSPETTSDSKTASYPVEKNRLGFGNPNIIICTNRGEHYHKIPDLQPIPIDDSHANYIPSPATVVQYIRENLEDASINYPVDSPAHFFIPRDCIFSYLNYQTITSVVDSLPCCNHLSTDEKRAFVQQICFGNTQSRYPCRKLLGVLIAVDLQDDLLKLINDGINDGCLPLRPVSKNQYALQCTDRSHRHTSIAGYRKFRSLRISQWAYAVTAPYFKKPAGRHVHYVLDHNDVLPIIQAGIPKPSEVPDNSLFGDSLSGDENEEAQSVQFHPSHFDFGQDETAKDGTLYTLKRLASTDRDVFHKELASLLSLQGEESMHLIKLLVTFEIIGNQGRKSSDYFLVFPWGQGTLWNYWRLYQDRKTRLSRGPWMAEQCLQLAIALQLVHNDRDNRIGNFTDIAKDDEELYLMHGDVNAENILWFKADDILVMTDFGLGRIHQKMTDPGMTIHDDPRSVGGSVTYQAPEFGIMGEKISRASDIYSMGCMFLEFVTWHLEGWEAVHDIFPDHRLERDHFGFISDIFFQVEKGTAGVETPVRKGKVKDWIMRLKHHPDCTQYHVDFLMVINNSMLEPTFQKRIKLHALKQELEVFAKLCRTDSEYFTKPAEADLNPDWRFY